jgi:hypothetical protein
MRLVRVSAFVIALGVSMAPLAGAQEDPDRVVAGGGISAAGWKGKIDPQAAQKGRTINDSKFAQEGKDLHLTIGPAAVYWNPAHTATGDYSVKATFKEAKVTAGHPHPYGIFIGGNKLDTDQQSLMYCVAYGDGTYLIRLFNGATVTTLSKRQPHAAVNKAGAEGSVTNDVAWTVKGGRAECSINGTMVAGFDKGEIVGAGKLESTDGVYGLRASHNLDVVVSGLAKN